MEIMFNDKEEGVWFVLVSCDARSSDAEFLLSLRIDFSPVGFSEWRGRCHARGGVMVYDVGYLCYNYAGSRTVTLFQ